MERATLDPPLSPTLWTSIATGKRPYKHGIIGFTEPDPSGKEYFFCYSFTHDVFVSLLIQMIVEVSAAADAD